MIPNIYISMISKTIKISPLPYNTNKSDIQLVLAKLHPTKIHLKQNQAFVEVQDSSHIHHQFPYLKIPILNNAEIQHMGTEFKWSDFGSSESQVQQLIDEGEQKQQNSGELPIHLTQPESKNLIVIKKCDKGYLERKNSEEIKKQVFGQFQTMNRILKRQDSLILEFEDEGQKQKFSKEFYSFSELGGQATICGKSSDSMISNFAEDWIKQNESESSERPKEQSENKIQIQIQKCLHETPKFEKLTSIQGTYGNKKSEEFNISPLFSEQQVEKGRKNRPSIYSDIHEKQKMKEVQNYQQTVKQEVKQSLEQISSHLLTVENEKMREVQMEQQKTKEENIQTNQQRVEQKKKLMKFEAEMQKQKRLFILNIFCMGTLIIWDFMLLL